MNQIKKSLLRRIGILTVVLFVLIFLIYVLLSNRLIHNFFEDEIQKNLLKDARQIATEIDGFFGENKEVVEQMKTNEDFLTIMREIDSRNQKRGHPLYGRVQTALNRIKESNDDVSLVSLAIAGPNELITTEETYDPDENYDLGKRDWYKEAVEKKVTIVSKPYQDLVSGGWVVTISTPVYEKEKLLGTMAVDLKIEDVFTLIDNFQVGQNGQTFLLNQKGEHFYYPHRENRSIETIMEKQQFVNAFNEDRSNEKYSEYIYVGENEYYAYASTKNTNLVVGTLVPKDQALASIQRFSLLNILIFLVFLGIISLFLYYFSSRISRPMIRISNEVEAMGENNWKLNFPEAYFKREDEIGILVRGLRLMNVNVNQFLDEIEMQNRQLNDEIKSRKDVQHHLELILELISFSTEGIFIIDQQFLCIFANQSFNKLAAFSENELEGLNLLERKLFINDQIVEELKENKLWVGEIKYLPTSKMEESTLFLKLIEVKSNNKTYYIGNLTDITKEKRVQKNIYQLKYFDALTGLYNKTYFDEIVWTLIEKNCTKESIDALIIINIDNFRLINEAKGYEYGNQILIELGKKLSKFCQECDVLARLGNDEFAVFKTNLLAEEALYKKLSRLTRFLQEPLWIKNESQTIDVSMGISFYPGDGDDYLKLLKNATSALNNAKSDLENTFVFYNQEINQRSISKYEMGNSLRKALERNEFILYYQPQIDLISRQIIGVEALMRWKRQGEIISPDVFIPIAEESKLILPIGEWVLKEACQFANRLNKMGYAIEMAVNLSRLQFKDPYIIDLVKLVSEQTGLPLHLLELEITERVLMDNEKECRQIIDRLKEQGVAIAIDDFGTGYSSLAYLNKFNVDKIKIDRSFIKDIPINDKGVIAKVIIELAEGLNLSVIGEGVETEEQVAFLLKNQCMEAQGFLFSKPLPEEELLNYLKKINTL